MHSELLYRVALTSIPQVGHVQARILIDHFGNAAPVFNASVARLKNIEGIGEVRACKIRSFTAFEEAEREIRFIEENGITPLFITDQQYPKRLLNCYDAPLMLYYKGNADLNVSRIIAIVGSRHHSAYGKYATEKIIDELASHQVLVVSGLAYGIDAIAHKSSLKNNLNTVGVLAHGLGQVYPPIHHSLAMEMINQGGLLTEFSSLADPDRHNFPTRNRIVAGMSDATIVIETGIKGGSMITAELANGYNRDVFAFPGRTTDERSAGCNQLIRDNKACLITCAKELIDTMGWEMQGNVSIKKQREIFVELSQEEKVIVAILQKKEKVHIDAINLESSLSNSTVAAVVLNLEMQGIITALPGKMYSLL